jgi:CarD family transcriptional regulator
LVDFAVGDTVVYPAHGVGRIVAREQRAVGGGRQPVVVVALADGLTVSLPLDRAQSQLRPLASEADLGRVRQILRQEAVPSDKTWLVRRAELRDKLAHGRLVELAEIIRDSAPRQPATAGTKGAAGTEERNLFRQAYRVLSAEIAAVRGIDPPEADRWIERQLAHT